jgi:replicative DNA helicase
MAGEVEQIQALHLAEDCLLGAILFHSDKPKVIAGIGGILNGWRPSKPGDSLILDAVKAILSRGSDPDLPTINGELTATGNEKSSGGGSRLIELVDGVPNAENYEQYAREVLRQQSRLKSIRISSEIREKLAKGQPLDGDLERLALATAEVEAATYKHVELPLPMTVQEIRDAGKLLPEIEPIEPSIPDLKAPLSGGFRAGWMVIVGAFTGGGKTTWCVREAVHKAYLGHPVLYLSCELAKFEVQKRIDVASEEDGVCLMNPSIRVEDQRTDLPSVLALIAQWEAASRGKLSPVLIVDFIQRVQAESQPGREREVAIVAEELQKLTRTLGILTIAAAQLNRNSATETPQLHHLRESGTLEQVADVAFLINKTGDDRMTVELAKNRWGASGMSVDLMVDYARCRIAPVSEHDKLQAIGEKVAEYLEGKTSKSDELRDISSKIKVNGKHPKTSEIEKAAAVTKLYVLDGKKAKILG